MKKRYFDDLVVGEKQKSSRYTVTSEEITEFARRYDPQYFHADVDAARDSRFKEVIASGIQIMAIWRVLDHEIARDVAWICGVAWDDVRFLTPLRSGDTVYAVSECVHKRLSTQDSSRGVVKLKYALINQNHEPVWSCVSTNLIECAVSDDLVEKENYLR